jgi:hypothetical protein
MGRTTGGDEPHSLCGPVDRAALVTIRRVVEREEPLATPALDDCLDPTVLEVEFDDGLRGADSARIDVQWTTEADYTYHYTDSDELSRTLFGPGATIVAGTAIRNASPGSSSVVPETAVGSTGVIGSPSRIQSFTNPTPSVSTPLGSSIVPVS